MGLQERSRRWRKLKGGECLILDYSQRTLSLPSYITRCVAKTCMAACKSRPNREFTHERVFFRSKKKKASTTTNIPKEITPFVRCAGYLGYHELRPFKKSPSTPPLPSRHPNAIAVQTFFVPVLQKTSPDSSNPSVAYPPSLWSHRFEYNPCHNKTKHPDPVYSHT